VADTVKEIKNILSEYQSYSADEFLEKINEKSNQILEYFFELKEMYHNDSKKTLPIVLDFFQNFYSLFGLTYFYNRSP
jgi:hypothetical protein